LTGERFTATATAVAAEIIRARMEDSVAVITPEMAFRDCIAEWRASQPPEERRSFAERAWPDGPPFTVTVEVEELRATPARALRLRLYHDALEGPHWLTLLCQCAWLRGVVGDAAT
jgi:hypothetical protein